MEEGSPTISPKDTKGYLSTILESIRINYIFYITCVLCLWWLCRHTRSSMFSAFYTFIFISLFGYVAHAISHFAEHFKITDMLDTHFNNVLTSPKNWFQSIISKYLWFNDFHDKIHHDTTINKQPINIMWEFIGNFWMQAGILLLTKYLLFYTDNSTIVLWGISYATVHNINYVISPSKIHMNHHVNKFTNYGIDIWDIVFNTKMPGDSIEDINHYSINFIICSLIIGWWVWWRYYHTPTPTP